jgi:hypothetical protein
MKKTIKSIFWLTKQTIFGFVALYAFNFIGTFIGVGIASNLISYFLIGTLGFPGLLLVYIGNVLFTF